MAPPVVPLNNEVQNVRIGTLNNKVRIVRMFANAPEQTSMGFLVVIKYPVLGFPDISPTFSQVRQVTLIVHNKHCDISSQRSECFWIVPNDVNTFNVFMLAEGRDNVSNVMFD